MVRSVWRGGGGGTHARGMHDSGHKWQGACIVGGHVWQKVCVVGSCMAGDVHGKGMCGRGHAWQGHMWQGHAWQGTCMAWHGMCDMGYA